MSKRRTKPNGGPTKKKSDRKIIPEARREEPAEHLSRGELKRIFVSNLDRLMGLLGLSRKESARAMRVSYRLIRRIVTSGVSHIEARNIKNLTKIADYFALPSIDHLWRADLVHRLLSTEEGSPFIKKFRSQLQAERERRIEGDAALSQDEVGLLGRALGFEATAPMLRGRYADMVAAILSSSKAAQFKRVIEDYFQLATATGSDADG